MGLRLNLQPCGVLNLTPNLIYLASNLASFRSKKAGKFACSFNYAAKFSMRRANLRRYLNSLVC
ncbi:hypothetical protein [uncultured Campylobacter sp.]|uniref:hypothetical protein n=1 Tax=uncultured Campylobacter sp. TaxID=218934 RepID=UPI0026359494|nr:hypothetical protein [uncultured Campylobacter sp.]